MAANDVGRPLWRPAPTTVNVVTPPGGNLATYINQTFRAKDFANSTGDIPYMRVAEMWLIEAEARVRTGQEEQSKDVFTILMQNRVPGYTRSTATGDAYITEIMNSRRVELWGEGFPFLDLKRLHLPLNRNGANHNLALAVWMNVPAGTNEWQYIIPQTELNANKLVTQNPRFSTFAFAVQKRYPAWVALLLCVCRAEPTPLVCVAPIFNPYQLYFFKNATTLFAMHYFSQYNATQWMLMLTAAAIIGFTKAGIKGMDMLSVTLMALVFGSKTSTGVVLPLLCVADVAAVRYYHRHAQWRHFWRLAPWIAAGIGLGVWLGKELPEQAFRQWMAGIVLITIVMVVYTEWRKTSTVPQHAAFAAATGLATGFTTMLGNLAGAFANLYFLAMRMPRHDFIGTAAWLFLCINAVKLPLQALYWKNITAQSLLTDLVLLPALALGFLLGVRLVHRLHNHTYRRVVIVLTLAGALALLVR